MTRRTGQPSYPSKAWPSCFQLIVQPSLITSLCVPISLPSSFHTSRPLSSSLPPARVQPPGGVGGRIPAAELLVGPAAEVGLEHGRVKAFPALEAVLLQRHLDAGRCPPTAEGEE